MVDARSMRFDVMRYAYDPQNPLSGEFVRGTEASR
jgi:hypothetical protein